MAGLTPNTGVPFWESAAADILKQIYIMVGRDSLIAAIDNPNHIADDRALAMADAAAGLIAPYQASK